MKNKSLPFLIVIIFIIIFIILYKGLQETNIYIPESKSDYEVPSSMVKLFDTNETVNTTEIFESDKLYLLNIWSSWCVPCRDEHSFLIKLRDVNNLEIIGLNYKDDPNNAEKFINELGNPYEKILFDKDGTNAIEWGAFGVPESFLVYQKKIVKKFIGPLNQNSIDEINKLIK